MNAEESTDDGPNQARDQTGNRSHVVRAGPPENGYRYDGGDEDGASDNAAVTVLYAPLT